MEDESQEPRRWSVNVESMPRLTPSSAGLRAFAKAVQADEAVRSASVTLSPTRGILRALMEVEDARRGHAEEIAIAAFYRGLRAAGYDTERPGWQLQAEIVGPLPKP